MLALWGNEHCWNQWSLDQVSTLHPCLPFRIRVVIAMHSLRCRILHELHADMVLPSSCLWFCRCATVPCTSLRANGAASCLHTASAYWATASSDGVDKTSWNRDTTHAACAEAAAGHASPRSGSQSWDCSDYCRAWKAPHNCLRGENLFYCRRWVSPGNSWGDFICPVFLF